MSDVVVTCPKWFWREWIEEGDLPGEHWSHTNWSFHLGGRPPKIERGERVYVVAHGKLRGYAPLYLIDEWPESPERGFMPERPEGYPRGYALVRRGGAVAVTIEQPIPGFRGFRYRWWSREAERPFPEWQTP